MTPSISENELNIPENKAALAYLEMRRYRPGMTHPDIAERLRALAQTIENGTTYHYGPTTILVAGEEKLVVGIGISMAYALKVGDMLEVALTAGAETIKVWGDKTTLDVSEAIAPDWVLGTWKSEEALWLQSAVDSLKTGD